MMNLSQDAKGWAVAVQLKKIIDEDPVAFEAVLPCILAYWINKTGVTGQELSAQIQEALKDQHQNRCQHIWIRPGGSEVCVRCDKPRSEYD